MQLLHLNSDSETWHDGLHDWQLLHKWDEIKFRAPNSQNVYAIGSAYNRVLYLMDWTELQID